MLPPTLPSQGFLLLLSPHPSQGRDGTGTPVSRTPTVLETGLSLDSAGYGIYTEIRQVRSYD